MDSVTAAFKEKIRSAYREGDSLRDIAAERGISHVQVRRILQSMGEPLRVPCKTTNDKSLTLEERVALRKKAILILHSAAMPVAEVAAAFGHKRKWVLQLLRECGVQV